MEVANLDRKKVVDCWNARYRNRSLVNLPAEGEFSDAPTPWEPTGSTFRFMLIRGPENTVRSAEDNLIKGAGGQAIQAMNACQGYDESEGLKEVLL